MKRPQCYMKTQLVARAGYQQIKRTTRLIIAFAAVWLATLCGTARAAILQLNVTYTNGHIVSGPLSADLAQLPDSVQASFILNWTGGNSFVQADVLQSSLVFGDGAWSEADLQSFSATMLIPPLPADITVTSLTYAYAPKDTGTVLGRLSANFPLTIQGIDRASEQAFEYQYDSSTQLVTVVADAVPEPGAVPPAAIGLLWLSCFVLTRKHQRT